MTMIELVQLRLAKLAAKLELVLAHRPGNIIGQVTGDVVTALGRSLTDRIEA